ncbi:hypothetical protein KFE26_14395 [Shewanella sp. M16]|uniref:hypothetical protein n=1 Tax=Shewanella sp. M16 TaxID=2830837 RepID=UPI001BAF4C7F|nr:hypothetical protein [Shewanella sp. M16]MBS0043477.1 hypothetical protein [Shewanella sp. M16]
MKFSLLHIDTGGAKWIALTCKQNTQWLTELSTDMEVTVDGMDAVVEPIGTYLRRVTGMTVLTLIPRHRTSMMQC